VILRARAELILVALLCVATVAVGVVLTTGSTSRASASARSAPSAQQSTPAPPNSAVLGEGPDVRPGQDLVVTSGGYAPLTAVEITLDGSSWHETVRADRLGQVIFTFVVPLVIAIGKYVLEISGGPPSSTPPPPTHGAEAEVLSVTIPKVTLFPFAVR
jgi:hypothetical protein